ncbi:hypothetical protein MesoLj113c_61910 [Mesorhizobium sp. 113-3-9]|uniref:hypothetical protein n=1 Tax=Mesorhizobium sp. 113-3-9 TaxID=2744517 RepID=UPI00193556C9|nr:hypothetical protein [Mesorhizobium sp. 113-3-9]BCG90081.1 hypothetical protein MesoLj113c_61910 [Mesorhizobium sp. 113-3-9]
MGQRVAEIGRQAERILATNHAIACQQLKKEVESSLGHLSQTMDIASSRRLSASQQVDQPTRQGESQGPRLNLGFEEAVYLPYRVGIDHAQSSPTFQLPASSIRAFDS